MCEPVPRCTASFQTIATTCSSSEKDLNFWSQYTISNQDHPITKLIQSPFKAARSSHVLISLNSRYLDRTELTEKVYCETDSESFRAEHKVEYTKLNCEFFDDSGSRCSLLPFYGIPEGTKDYLFFFKTGANPGLFVVSFRPFFVANSRHSFSFDNLN